MTAFPAAMPKAPLPNFFVVGAGKAGTTSLYRYLCQHPRVYMSPIKEPCYFSSEIRVENLTESFLQHQQRMSRKLRYVLGRENSLKPMGWLVADWEDYVRLFENVRSETAIGEASAAYLWSASAAERIAVRIPDARIVMVLRDPSERAFSQYLHQLAAGLTRSTFREHIKQCMRETKGKLSIYNPLLEVGLYHQQVRRYLDRFPRNNIRIYWFEEAWQEPQQLLADLFDFLGVDSTFCPDTSTKFLERRAPRFPAINHVLKRFEVTGGIIGFAPSWLRSPFRRLLFQRGHSLTMDANDRRYLIDYYRDDIEKLESLLKRDLSAWLR